MKKFSLFFEIYFSVEAFILASAINHPEDGLTKK